MTALPRALPIPCTLALQLLILLALLVVMSRQHAAADAAFYASLAEGDQALAAATVQEALETAKSKESRSWRNATSGASGFVTPLRTYKIESGHYCREYQEAIATPAGAEARLFTACRSKDDGRWVPVTNKG